MTDKIITQLSKVQAKLKAPKNQTNKFGGYSYRSCEDILEAVKPLLVESELVLTISDDIWQVSNRIYVKATATVSNGTEIMSTTAYAREPELKKGMDEAQITGSASSYARKYALNGLFCIDDTKDSDYTNKHDKEEKQVIPEKKSSSDGFTQSEAQRKMLFALVTEAGLSTLQMKELLKNEYGLESSSELTRLQFEEIITFLNNEIKRNKEQQQPL